MPNESTEGFGVTGGQVGPAEAPGFFDELLSGFSEFDFGDFLSGAAGTALDVLTAGSPILGLFGQGGIFGETQQPVAHPGGAPLNVFPQLGGGLTVPQPQQPFLGPQNIFSGIGTALGIGPGGGGVLPGGSMPHVSTSGVGQIVPQQSTSTRLPSTVHVPYHTATGQGKIATYKNMGRAILFTGDLAAARRVRRVASKARSRLGGRR